MTTSTATPVARKLYASKTPRDLNRDPQPWFEWETGARYTEAEYEEGVRNSRCWYGLFREPRPEYDHPQHNEPNPYLLAFREYCAHDPESLWWAAGVWLNRLIEPDESYDAQHAIDLVDATLDDVTRAEAKAHLIAVLNRLEGIHDARFAAA